MKHKSAALFVCAVFALPAFTQQLPHATPTGYELPNGWRLTPQGRSIPTEDMVLNVSVAPDRKAVVALHAGFNPHGLVVVDSRSEEAAQRMKRVTMLFETSEAPPLSDPSSIPFSSAERAKAS